MYQLEVPSTGIKSKHYTERERESKVVDFTIRHGNLPPNRYGYHHTLCCRKHTRGLTSHQASISRLCYHQPEESIIIKRLQSN